MEVTPTISIKITPTTPMQVRMLARYVSIVRSMQDTQGTGILMDINYPGVQIMLPYVRVKQEVR